jgi:hypothetical protein
VTVAPARHRDRRPSRPLRLAAGAIGFLLGLVLLDVVPAAAQSGEMGVATIRSRSGEPIEGGGSATEFTIDLPDGAECPGDSTNDEFRVGSYMLPATLSPFDVEWTGEGPEPYGLGDYDSFRQPLYDDLTAGYSSKLLAENEEPGQPGQILDFPAFTFDVYEPGMIPDGRYNVGIICTYFLDVTTAWNAVIEVETDTSDAPAQIRWTIVEGSAPAESSSNDLLLVGVVVGGVVTVAAAVFLLLRNRSTPGTDTSQNTREIR